MEPLFEIQFVVTPKMLAENARKYGVGPRIPTVILCSLLFAAIIVYVTAAGHWKPLRGFVISIAVIELVVFFLPNVLAGLQCLAGKKYNGGTPPMGVVTVSDAITYQWGPVNMCFTYEDLIGAVPLKHSYKLRFANRKSILLNPDGFTKGTFEEFKAFLREKRPDLNIPG